MTDDYVFENLGMETVDDYVNLTGVSPTGDIDLDITVMLAALKVEMKDMFNLTIKIK